MGWLARRRERLAQESRAYKEAADERKERVRRGRVPHAEMGSRDQEERLLAIDAEALDRVEKLAAKTGLPVMAIRRAVYGELLGPRSKLRQTMSDEELVNTAALMGRSVSYARSVFIRDFVNPISLYRTLVELQDFLDYEHSTRVPLSAFEALIAERGNQAVVVSDWRVAEEVAARWMRGNGWPDAQVTGKGSDAGIDVVSTGAVAQVKWFLEARVGRPALQRLQGAAGRDRRALFFACAEAGNGRPYSREAIAWAVEYNIDTLVIDAFGQVRLGGRT